MTGIESLLDSISEECKVKYLCHCICILDRLVICSVYFAMIITVTQTKATHEL